MASQLFIYYRIQKVDIDAGLACARLLMNQLQAIDLGTGTLYQREEADKPYFTLMEVITPSAANKGDMLEFSKRLEQLAADCFSGLPNCPARHTEIFNEIEPPCA